MKLLKKGLLIAGLSAAMGVASTSAMAAFNDFQVQEGVITDTPDNLFTADRITGGYAEVITFNANGTVDVSLKWEAGQFLDGNDPAESYLGTLGKDRYGLYALFQASGTFTLDGAGGASFDFGPGGSLLLAIDTDLNTTFGQPGDGATAWTLGGTGDDVTVATGAAVSGTGVLDPNLDTCGEPDPNNPNTGINCGSFGTTTSIDLTAFGTTYFVDPIPFFNLAFESGQLNEFSPTGTQLIDGSLDVVFGNAAVPEPSTLALMGLGMLGLGVMRRRKQKS